MIAELKRVIPLQAMIQDLKADSARWDAERRAASRGQPGAAGGTLLSSQPNAKFVRSSNSPTAPSRGNDGYRNSETHHQRQYYGPTSADPAYGDAMAIDSPSYSQPPMRYPGTGNSGYNGVNSAYVAQQQRYEAQQNAYNSTAAAQYGAAAQQSYSPAPQASDMYAAGMPAGAAGMVPQPAFRQPSSIPDSQYVRGAAYQNAMATTSMPSRSMYPTAAPVYATQAAEYGYAQPVGPSGSAAAGYAQPIDAAYGRGSSSQQPGTIPAPSDYLASPAGNQPQTGYSTVLPESQYAESQPQLQSQNPAQAPSRNSVTPASSSQAQISSSGQTSSSSTSTRRDRDRDRDRDQDRHRREDRDRDTDRHAADRHSRRHGAR